MNDPHADIATLVERDYHDALGRHHHMSDAVMIRLIAALAGARGADRAPAPLPRGGRCFLPDWQRGWGIAAQLYGLRSPRNWGIGDFTDLQRLIELAAVAGADFVGVNPLHACYAADPARISPYSPSSREFINVLYLDPLAMTGYAESGAARAVVASRSFQALLAQQRANATVAYAEIAAAKQSIFRVIFDTFEHRIRAAPRDEAVRDFAAFVKNRGKPLRCFAAYQALSSLAGFGPDWMSWPAEFRYPAGPAATEFAEHHARELRYHTFLQWQADRQLGACAAAALRGGMRIGLYLDLALGCAPDSAEGWAGQDEIVPDFHVGAPPDDWNANGQDWGLFAYNPEVMLRAGCETYRRIVAANMIHAGAVRIDHVLGLNRLFLVPAGGRPVDGAYLRMPFDALGAAIAAESTARNCVVVGEDLGTVPPDLPPRLAATGILSCRLLIFMRQSGRYLAPTDYPPEALVALTTHDLPTWRGFWEGRDLELKYALGIRPADIARDQALTVRASEREAIRAAFAHAGLDTAADAALAVAAHRFLAQTPSRLALVQLEDLAQEVDQVNLPGASAGAYPSFARKLGRDLDTVFADPTANAILAAMRAERSRPSPR
ncbi:MAG: 4-alpha-glucanotransferase [Alphaproteobacteria bacterium]|nr:4-alpha-glucanotransferase [Alphaproteobacteria bacterium]